MRIAIIVSSFPALSETFVINHVVALMDRGHDVSVFAYRSHAEAASHGVVAERGLDRIVRPLDPSIDPPLDPHVSDHDPRRLLRRLKMLLLDGWREPGITLRSLDPRIGGRATFILTPFACARAFAGRRDFDIVHCHFGWSGVVGARLRRAGAIRGKLVVTFHGSDVNVPATTGSAQQWKMMCDTADWFTANTNFIRDRAAELGCPRERCSIWHMGVDTNLFTFRERTLSPGEPVRIITVARLMESKGVEFAIRALPLVQADGRRVEYHVVGDGPLRRDLENLAQELGVGDQVVFHGSQPAETVRRLLDRSHIFVLPAVTARDNAREGQSVVLIEAQASGLPVVSTHYAGIPEAVRDGQSGYLVPERAPPQIAARLSELVRHPESWGPMGRAGREFVMQEFALDRCSDTIASIYKTALS